MPHCPYRQLLGVSVSPHWACSYPNKCAWPGNRNWDFPSLDADLWSLTVFTIIQHMGPLSLLPWQAVPGASLSLCKAQPWMLASSPCYSAAPALLSPPLQQTAPWHVCKSQLGVHIKPSHIPPEAETELTPPWRQMNIKIMPIQSSVWTSRAHRPGRQLLGPSVSSHWTGASLSKGVRLPQQDL